LDKVKEMLAKAEHDASRVKKLPPPPKLSQNKAKADPDEMVLHPKSARKTKDPNREKRLKAALDRIKALSRIDRELHADNAASPPIKGNKISKGSSTAEDAKESDDANYYDSVRSRLQENWALPVWLSRQNLSAQIEIVIDSHGRVREFRFKKSSGNTQFDDAVKKTLAESQPFPTPPSELLMNGILVGFPL
jgi:TolA protein